MPCSLAGLHILSAKPDIFWLDQVVCTFSLGFFPVELALLVELRRPVHMPVHPSRASHHWLMRLDNVVMFPYDCPGFQLTLQENGRACCNSIGTLHLAVFGASQETSSGSNRVILIQYSSC